MKKHPNCIGPPTAFAAALTAVLVSGYGISALYASSEQGTGPETASRSVPATSSIPASFAELAARVRPAVVFISTEGVQPVNATVPGNPLGGFPELFERFGPQRVSGVGSGFIVSDDGLVVTNYHVIKDAHAVQVTLDDGTEHHAKIVGTDPKTDLALLRVEVGKPLPTVTFGNSDDTRVGDWVVAVGNPFGLGGSVSAGIVSARGRNIHSGPYDDYLQFDAPINQGNSGGPLFNTRGEVVGVNTAIFSPSGGNVGIGFAVPASTAQPVVAQLQSHGRVARGWLGVHIQRLNPEIATSLGLEEARGALVLSVTSGSPAQQAGVVRGDVITSVDGTLVADIRETVRTIGKQPIGQQVAITIWRDGAEQVLQVTLTEVPQRNALAENTIGSSKGDGRARALGVGLAALSEGARQRFGISEHTKGALIVAVAPDSRAAASNLRPGDVIVMIDRAQIEHPRDVAAAVAQRSRDSDRPLLLLVERQGEQRFIAVAIG